MLIDLKILLPHPTKEEEEPWLSTEIGRLPIFHEIELPVSGLENGEVKFLGRVKAVVGFPLRDVPHRDGHGSFFMLEITVSDTALFGMDRKPTGLLLTKGAEVAIASYPYSRFRFHRAKLKDRARLEPGSKALVELLGELKSQSLEDAISRLEAEDRDPFLTHKNTLRARVIMSKNNHFHELIWPKAPNKKSPIWNDDRLPKIVPTRSQMDDGLIIGVVIEPQGQELMLAGFLKEALGESIDKLADGSANICHDLSEIVTPNEAVKSLADLLGDISVGQALAGPDDSDSMDKYLTRPVVDWAKCILHRNANTVYVQSR